MWVPAPKEPAAKFNQVFQHLVSQDKVLFGLEDFRVPQVSDTYLQRLTEALSAAGLASTTNDFRSMAEVNNRRLAQEGVREFSSKADSYAAFNTTWQVESGQIVGTSLLKKELPRCDDTLRQALNLG